MSAAAAGIPLPSSTAARTSQLIRVRPAPRREPPFDDEIASGHLHLVGPLDQQLPFEQAAPNRDPAPSPRRTRPDLPDPSIWARRLLIGIIETAAGKRPLQQLASLLSTSVAQGLGADFERAAIRRRPHWISTAAVRSIRACEPAEGVAELCATVHAGPRVRAVALRLEARHGRWRCTRLQVG